MASVAQAQAVVKEGVLTDATGRTLYTFDKDPPTRAIVLAGACKPGLLYVAEVAPGAKLLPGLTRFEQNGTQHFVSVALSRKLKWCSKTPMNWPCPLKGSGYKLLNLPARLYTVVCVAGLAAA